MVLVVQNVQKIAVERVDVVKAREVLDDGGQLLVIRLLRELDLAHVKLPDPREGIVLVDDCGRLTLRPGEHNVDKVLARGHHRDLLEIVLHHLDSPAKGARTGLGAREAQSSVPAF